MIAKLLTTWAVDLASVRKEAGGKNRPRKKELVIEQLGGAPKISFYLLTRPDVGRRIQHHS